MTIEILAGVHPELVRLLTRVYSAMSMLGMTMRPTEGVRTEARQQSLYSQGRTTSGNIVTNADGVTNKSNHQVKEDGLGYAVDSCFVGDDPYLEHDPRSQVKWNTYGACLRAVGLTWGGDWVHISDRPHAELPYLPSSKGNLK